MMVVVRRTVSGVVALACFLGGGCTDGGGRTDGARPAALAAAASAASPPSASASASAASASASASASACPDVTGQAVATDGTLSAGPFTAEGIAPNPNGTGYKIWVGSTTAGPPEVTILTYPPGSSAAKTYRRTETAEVPNLARFFPGLIQIPTRGTWRFLVRYDGDELCFTVNYPAGNN
jgi:hypothetical protein